MSILSAWKKAVSATGNYVATRAFLRTPDADLTPGAGEVQVNAQQVEVLAFGSVGAQTAVTLTAGQRASDGFAEVGLAANPKRTAFRVRVKAGPAYLGFTVSVDASDGTPFQATESDTIYGYTGIVYVADDGTHPVDVRFLEWSTP